ncbi:MAG: hypothetical protein BGO12_08635 [Verrucomicrobia bacterium 61-8]|nr:response regulator [Verrucomicrobiota bacterium]OJV11904.1 MAG: hypothetical protein BGO12_08635 [Verrucomicrobia bacterium 61-8]
MTTNDPNPRCGILYIDDEEKALKYFRMAFSEKFEIFTANSGREGLEILRRESSRIGVVISDQRMPEMLGAEVLGIVREEFPSVIRIITTAYSDLESAIQAVNKGYIYQYVVKPWEIRDLGMVLQRAADYFRVLTERNELLALKMATLQRILCSDRVKWLLLSSASWEPAARGIFRRALLAAIQALPLDPAFLASPAARNFDIGSLIRSELAGAADVAPALNALKGSHATPEAAWEALSAALAARHGLTAGKGGGFSLAATGAASGGALHKDLFGLLLGNVSGEAPLRFFEFLYALAASGSAATAAIADVTVQAPSEASEDAVIDALAAKFSAWDISRL